jgi:hypothetical protein
MRIKYCDWDDKYKRVFIERTIFIYLVIIALILVQNSVFNYLVANVHSISFSKLFIFIFINNSIANFSLFISFFLILYYMIPPIIEGCKSGLLLKEALFTRKYMWAIILFAISLAVFMSIMRVVFYTTGSFSLPYGLQILAVLTRYKHTYFEVGGYIAGSLPVILKDKKVMCILHSLSYILILLGAYYETLLAMTASTA